MTITSEILAMVYFHIEFVMYEIQYAKKHLDDQVPQPFAGLETEYLQTKYFREKLQLLVHYILCGIYKDLLPTFRNQLKGY